MITILAIYFIKVLSNSFLFVICALADPECGDVPLLTPGSKEMMSQALKATFSGFTKEQQRLGIPKGRVDLYTDELLNPGFSTEPKPSPKNHNGAAYKASYPSVDSVKKMASHWLRFISG